MKTQISFSANLSGINEEEHSGGAFISPSYSLGDTFREDMYMKKMGMRWKEVVRTMAPLMNLKKEGYGIDKKFPHILYVPESAVFNLNKRTKRC